AGAAGRAGARRGRARCDAAQGPGLVPGGAARGLMDLRALVPEWIRTLTPYPPGKPIEELERELGIRDSIKLASNENPLGPSPKAVAAITAALGDLHRYPDGSAFYLKRRLAGRLGVSEAEVIVGNGSNEIIELAVRTFLRPGDEAVMADQAFVVYRLVVQSAGGSSRMVPLRDFTHDLEAIAAAVTPRTRLVFLGNPNNPTGTIVRRAAWRAFLGRLPEHLLVVADDAYAEYVEDPEYPDTIRERGDGRVAVLSLRTFSKLYGLAGLRVGYGVAAGPVVDALDRIRQPFNVNALALAGAHAALDDEEHVRRAGRRLARGDRARRRDGRRGGGLRAHGGEPPPRARARARRSRDARPGGRGRGGRRHRAGGAGRRLRRARRGLPAARAGGRPVDGRGERQAHAGGGARRGVGRRRARGR